MGTEIFSVFIFVPIFIAAIASIKIVRNKNRLKHSILLVATFCFFGYFYLTPYLDGFNPMQGVVIGSLVYLPSYLMFYCGLTIYFRKIGKEN